MDDEVCLSMWDWFQGVLGQLMRHGLGFFHTNETNRLGMVLRIERVYYTTPERDE